MEGVEIVIKPIHLERFIYWVLIIALAVLLIIKWGGDCDTTKQTKETGTATGTGLNQTNQTLNTTNATQQNVLCSNGVKDQDETDVDCGGAKCSGCAEYKNCNIDTDCATGSYCQQHIKCVKATCDDELKNQGETNIDCGGQCASTNGAYWYDNACHKEAKPVYSGKIEAFIDAKTSLNADTGFVRIDSVTFKVANGKDTELLGATAYIYAKDGSGSPYPPEGSDGELRVLNYPSPPTAIPALAPGKNYTVTLNISKTLPQTESTDDYSVRIEVTDSKDYLLAEKAWTG